MILARIEEEQLQANVIRKKHKFNPQQKNTMRSTTYTIRKTSPTHKLKLFASDTNPVNESDLRVTQTRSSSQDIVEHTCSNFMKNYVDKLKRQRKREKKKIMLANNCKAQQEIRFLTCDVAPLPIIHHGKQRILILEQISPSSYQSSLTHQIPSVRGFDNDVLSEVIRQFKQSKGKAQIQRNALNKKFSDGFPLLDKRQNRLRPAMTIDRLDPWQNQWANIDLPYESDK